jgi:hypothetical protein
MKPCCEVRIIHELVLLKELIDNHSTSWQSVKAVILVVFVPKLVYAYNLPANGLILLLDIPLTPT